MHEDIKKYADEGNIKGLKYSFSNSLDVDPTFEKYRDDFEYCKEKKVFEKHNKLTPLEVNNPSNWNDTYWVTLKKDLFENFSQKRLEHMIKVAKVIYKDKIERLIEERQRPKEEEPEYTTITSEPTEEEKAIEKQENEKKITEQIVTEANELEKTNEVIETAIIQKQDEIDKSKKEAEITSSNIKRENANELLEDILKIIVGVAVTGILAYVAKIFLSNTGKKSIKDRVQAILHSKKISPNEKIVRLENIKAELSNRLNSSKDKRKIEEYIEKINHHIKSLQQAETFIDENSIEEQ